MMHFSWTPPYEVPPTRHATEALQNLRIDDSGRRLETPSAVVDSEVLQSFGCTADERAPCGSVQKKCVANGSFLKSSCDIRLHGGAFGWTNWESRWSGMSHRSFSPESALSVHAPIRARFGAVTVRFLASPAVSLDFRVSIKEGGRMPFSGSLGANPGSYGTPRKPPAIHHQTAPNKCLYLHRERRIAV